MHRFVIGSIALAFAGCTPVPAPVTPRLENAPPPESVAARTALPDGDYACTMTSGEYSYQPYLCRVATTDGVTRLVKLEGSQRVRGSVTFDGDGAAHFHGEFYCNGGGCNRPVEAVFAPSGDRAWAGSIGGEDSLRLVYQPGGMYGGVGYGADAWADDGYGDNGYGGGYGLGGNSYGGYGYGGYGYGTP
ncbi:MAG: DUF4893 domain-containing protein [Deltaproteobacteria bacterium]|nr:DUF4893 domain-containing protein [Deltaproteobacteria bacterium]